MKNDERRTIKILCIFGIIPVVWLALLIAPFVSGGLMEIVAQFPAAMEHPFQIELCEDSRKTVLIFLLIYALSIGVALSSRRNYRRGEEHGSAKWGSASAVNKKYQAKDPEANKVFTKHVRMGLDGRKHRRNLNTVVVGGSGSGKSRFYALINLLQACSSYFVLDCKGELLRMTGTFLKMRGYEIKVLDLLSMEKSHCFNPFAYLETDNDVQKLVTSLFKATTPKGSQSNDPFWDTAASMLLSAIIFYLLYEAPEEEQNFPMVMEMLRAGEVREDDDTYQSPLDELFERLEMRNPDHIAVKYYNIIKNIVSTKKEKNTQKLPMPSNVKKGFRRYCAVVVALALCSSLALPASATGGDPLTVVNNLSDFIFGMIRAVGMILLGWGIVQVGLSFQSHDPSQRSNGFLTLAGGVIITFAKEILTLITG